MSFLLENSTLLLPFQSQLNLFLLPSTLHQQYFVDIYTYLLQNEESLVPSGHAPSVHSASSQAGQHLPLWDMSDVSLCRKGLQDIPSFGSKRDRVVREYVEDIFDSH